MAKARAIVKRRKAVQNIRKITRTMQLIATARFQKAFQRATAARPYADKIGELVEQVAGASRDLEHPLLRAPEIQRRVVLFVVTSNRGMCGGYNAGVLRVALERLERVRSAGTEAELHVVGKKGIAYFRFLKVPLAGTYTTFDDRPRYAEAEQIADGFMSRFVAGAIDGVEVVSTRFYSTARQRPEVMPWLPMGSIGAGGAGGPLYEFRPSAGQLLADLLPRSLKVRLFQALLDAAVSEQVARMVAMKAATDAAGEMIRMLTTQYNRARQTQITLELLDIVGGAEALK